MSLFAELKRRNVFRIALFYVVSSWLILQVGDVVFGLMGIPEWGLRLVFGILLLGFPIALILSWVYELTPEGIKREAEIDRSESVTHQTARKLDIAVIVVVIAGIGVALSDRLVPSGEQRAETPSAGFEGDSAASRSVPGGSTGEADDVSIAVLPFRDMSAAGDQDYFAEGIAEELLNALVRVDGLRVASRTSSFSYKGKDLNLPTIARELNVSHVLEGSVRTAGNQVRVTAQLIDVARDAHLWSETFDRTLDDIFAIQDEITEQVLEELVVYLGQAEAESVTQALTSNAEAYRLYLQGRHLWRQRSPDELRRAIDLFKQAVALDPEFARAWANLGAAYMNLPEYDPEIPSGAFDEESAAAADRALEIDPDIAEALSLRAMILQDQCDWIGAEKLFRRAAAAEPNDPTTRHWHALMLGEVGHSRAAVQQAETAFRLDPLNAAIVSTLGDQIITTGDFERAAELWEDAANLGLDRGSRWPVGYAMALDGDIEAARPLLLSYIPYQSTQRDPELMEAFLAALNDSSQVAALENHVERALAANTLGLFSATMLLAPVNASTLLELINDGALCSYSNPFIWLPQADELRANPRFFEALAEAGIVDYWREFGWPDRCEELDPELAECP